MSHHAAKSKPRRKSIVRSAATPQGERLQKLLAAAGLGSRRQCEELILAGRVEIDRQMVDELGVRADPETQEIRVDGEVVAPSRKVYYVVNKPEGVVSTNRDPSGRPRVIDLVPGGGDRLFAVGRLDMASEGLILVTNDGPLADRLTHPRYGVEKTYHVRVAGYPEMKVLEQLKRGVHLAEGVGRVVHVKIKGRRKQSTILEIVLDEGRNREIRRLLARLGHKVLQLTRIAVGPIRLGDMPVGAYRELTPDEIRQLRRLVEEPVGAGKVFRGTKPTGRRGSRGTGSTARKSSNATKDQRGSTNKSGAPSKPQGATASGGRASRQAPRKLGQKAKIRQGRRAAGKKKG